MGIMAKTDLTNQRRAFVEEYVRSGDHLEAAKKAGYTEVHALPNQVCKLRSEGADKITKELGLTLQKLKLGIHLNKMILSLTCQSLSYTF